MRYPDRRCYNGESSSLKSLFTRKEQQVKILNF